MKEQDHRNLNYSVGKTLVGQGRLYFLRSDAPWSDSNLLTFRRSGLSPSPRSKRRLACGSLFDCEAGGNVFLQKTENVP
jgi:hypothetical protein